MASLFSPVQFPHDFTAHVRGPHGFPDTEDVYRPYGPNVTEDEDPKGYASDPIAHSGQLMKSVYHGESWNKPYNQGLGEDMPEFEKPEHATYGHSISHMVPR